LKPARSGTDAQRVKAAPSGIRPAIALVAPPPPSLRARQLFHEARRASLEHLEALQSAVTTARELSEAVAEDETLYGPGLAAFAGRLAEDLFWRSKTLEMLSQRQRLSFIDRNARQDRT